MLEQTLSTLYAKILGTVNRMPESAAYRRHTEQIVRDRLALVQSEPTVEGLEAKLNSGLIEEVVIQAENELVLARRMLEFKAWEPLVQQPPENQWKWPV